MPFTITEAQIHVFENPPPPERQGAFAPHRHSNEVISEMDAAGVSRAVLVPPGWEPNETALDASRRWPDRFRTFGHLEPDSEHARTALQGWLEQPGMGGMRLVGRQLDVLAGDSMGWFWSACEKQGIPLMLLAHDHLKLVKQVASQHAGLTLIIDHMAGESWTPTSGRGGAAFRNIDALLDLAMHPNVAVKLSAVPRYSAEPYPHADIHPFLQRIFAAFGRRRCFWGSDIGGPGMQGSYAECVNLFTEEVDFLSEEDKEWVLGRALSELLHWPVD